MKLRNLINKRLWCGLAFSIAVMTAMLALGALLIWKEVLGEEMMGIWVCVSHGVSVLCGGTFAAGHGEGRAWRSMLVMLFYYGLTWLLAWILSVPVDFPVRGWQISASVLAGGFAAILLQATRKHPKNHKNHTAKRSNQRR